MNPFPIDQIVPADPADTKPLACLIAEAFYLLDPSVWLIPDEEARREIFPGYFQMFVEDAFAHGLVYTTEDLSAVALWLENPGTPHIAEPGYDETLEAVTGVYAPRFRVFDQELDAHHLTGIAHHHLAILAVHPMHQNCGMGTALLTRHHRQLDETGTPAYLEAGDAGTRELYLRHGYADLGSGPIVLPDGPRMYPMIRPAR
jgi:GNAT superfamily N-acetyltransferase